MSPTAVDSSVMVAALLTWHETHARAFRAVEQLLRDQRLIVPVPALIESYSVMTRLPPPHRLNPADARAVLNESFSRVPLVGFPTRDLWRFLGHLADRSLGGGLTYDAVILECAREGNAGKLLTLNLRDYERLDVSGIEIVSPAKLTKA